MLGASKLPSSCVARSSLDLSDRRDLGGLARLVAVVRQAAGTTPILLVGAAARDLLLLHAHGIELQRATEDTDLALAVHAWPDFLALRERLVASYGFTAGGPLHRLWRGDQRVDWIPFGGVERSDRTIAWPTEAAEVMSTAGLAEGLAMAVTVRLPSGVVMDVAPVPVLALLKLWAWADRKYTAPGKDAFDLWMFLRHYAEAGNEDRLFAGEGANALSALRFDVARAGAWLLGADARAALAHGPDREASLRALDVIFEAEVDPEGALRLVAHMPPGDRDRQLSLLRAFHKALLGDDPSAG